MSDPRDELTEKILRDAGIAEGMQVLDIGCGNGNVSLMLRRLVGERGKVLGVDRDAAALAAARDRADALGFANVSFASADLSALPPELGNFDAAVGRRVLMYLPDLVAAFRGIGAALRPGGILVFQEHDATMVPGYVEPMPLHQQVHRWIWQTVEREGANLHIGFELPNLLQRAGLTLEHMRAEAIVHTPGATYSIAAIVQAMLPRIIRHNVASETEIDIDTLQQRLTAERTRANSTYVSDMVFSGWARKP
jgi:SAM-dependent methyltransferase